MLNLRIQGLKCYAEPNRACLTSFALAISYKIPALSCVGLIPLSVIA